MATHPLPHLPKGWKLVTPPSHRLEHTDNPTPGALPDGPNRDLDPPAVDGHLPGAPDDLLGHVRPHEHEVAVRLRGERRLELGWLSECVQHTVPAHHACRVEAIV